LIFKCEIEKSKCFFIIYKFDRYKFTMIEIHNVTRLYNNVDYHGAFESLFSVFFVKKNREKESPKYKHALLPEKCDFAMHGVTRST